ncbi:MAG: glycosyltransferase [Gammaproteobacteria bacterium]
MASWEFNFSSIAALFWLLTLLMPWQAWRTREVLEVDSEATDPSEVDLCDVTVVIPARNEAEVIVDTLSALKRQGSGLKVILVDDDSSDGTSERALQAKLDQLSIVKGGSLPEGWTGKLWAQEQGLALVQTPLTLLLDADIKMVPGLIKSLKEKQKSEGLQFVSLMAELRFGSFWERLLMPAFIYFFKMIYPFALANKPNSLIAVAAGGCILVETEVLRRIGGMAAIKDAVIDDCTLARKVKSAGYKTWIGLTHGVVSLRPYVTLTEIWEMVARTAYTQLGYSLVLLMVCSAIMVIMYWLPVLGMFVFEGVPAFLSVVSIGIMVATYVPLLRFYKFDLLWAAGLPIIASLYLMMTWTSALRYWRGERSRWKGRVYQNS